MKGVKSRAEWQALSEELVYAARKGDLPGLRKALQETRELPLGERMPEWEAKQALLNWRMNAKEGGLRAAIHGRGPSAPEVCEELMKDGMSPSWGWRLALSVWKRAKSQEESDASQRVVEAFLRAGATVEWEDAAPAIMGDGETPLWALCHYPEADPAVAFEARQRAQMARFLLDRGANANHVSGSGETPLWGCLRPEVSVHSVRCPAACAALTAELLSRGADPSLGKPGSVPLEAMRDPEIKKTLNAGAREVLEAWMEAAELREEIRPVESKAAVKRGSGL